MEQEQENALVNQNQGSNVPAYLAGGDAQYLPHFDLMQGLSGPVQQGQAKPGDYAVTVGTAPIILPAPIDIVPLAFRFKILDFQSFEVSYNVDSPLAKELTARSKSKDSNVKGGPEFLMFIAGKGIATWHMPYRTAQACGAILGNNLNRVVRIDGAALKQNKQNKTYYVPKLTVVGDLYDVPADAMQHVATFMAEKGSDEGEE